MTKYIVEIEPRREVPRDVLIEHLAYSLRAVGGLGTSVRILEERDVPLTEPRKHPFDGPEVFDDEVTEHTYATGGIVSGIGGPLAGNFLPHEIVNITGDNYDVVARAIGEDFPRLKELFDAKREEQQVRRSAEITEPLGEGDWELPTEDRVGDDID